MLTTKDLLYISDILEHHDALNKRMCNELSLINKSSIKTQFEDINQNLIEQFDCILELLKKES